MMLFLKQVQSRCKL